MNNRIIEGAKSVPSTVGKQKNCFDSAAFGQNVPPCDKNTGTADACAPQNLNFCEEQKAELNKDIASPASGLPQAFNALSDAESANGRLTSAAPIQNAHTPQYSPASASPGGAPVVPLAWQKKAFTADIVDILFIIAAFLLGYYFVQKLFLGGIMGRTYFNLFVFAVLFSAVGVAYLAAKRRITCKQGYLYIALGVLSALPSLFYPLYYPFLNTAFAAVLCTYGLTSLAGQRLENTLGEYFGKDVFNSLVYKPFRNFGAAFSAVFAFFHGEKKGSCKNAVFVVLGVAVCFLVGIPVAVLLCSADDIFNGWIGSFLSFNFDPFPLIFTVPVFLYLYGFLYSCANNRLTQSKSLFIIKQCEEGKTDKPQVLFLIPGVFLLFLYALFFAAHIVSLGKIVGGTPKIYAEFARQGFFQLCCVGAINLLFIIFSRLICAKKGTPRALRVCTTLIGVFTFALLIFAALKLGMYMNFCGLTEKRVCAAWAIFVIAAIFTAVIASQYKRFNCVKFSFFAVVISFIVLNLIGTGNITEFYNLNRCLNAETKQDYISEYVSSPESAALALHFAQSRATSENGDTVRKYTKEFAEQYSYYFFDSDFKNISYSAAKNLCKNDFYADSAD